MENEKTVVVAVRSRPLLQKTEELFNPGLVFTQSEVAIQDKGFTFDYVFPPDTTNSQVYNTAVANRLPRIFEGYNLTIFAYGQTGSGKTYTMGTNYPPVLQNESGIIFLSVTRMFEDMKLRKDEFTFVVNVSFLEVYKEDVYDLLSKDKKKALCQIREDFEGVKVVNLTEVPVNSVEDVLSVLEQGCQARSTASTAMNEQSSRSHSLFIISVEQISKENFETKKSKFQLVDLAGSERVDQSKTEGLRFKEGVDINKGLLALGKVISALSEGKSHIPYRDSRLTRLLMDSLGGNSYTLMIACISPSANNSDETISTLRYASRARKIKNKPVINNDPPEVQIQKLKSQVELLQAQLYKKSYSFDNISGCEEFSELKEQNSNLKKELQKSLARISALKEELIKGEEALGLLRVKVTDLYQQIQGIVNKYDDSSTVSANDVIENLKTIEEVFQDLILKSQEDIASETKMVELKEVESPVVKHIDIHSGSETSEEEVSSDIEVADIDRKIEKVELRLLQTQEIAQQYEVLNEALEQSSTKNVNVLQEKIDNLQKEKKELEIALKNSEKKLYEEQSKRYTECQSELKVLEKELLRTKLMKKIKEENKMKIDNLQREIQSLKSTKVKLLKKLKTENDNFKKIQLSKEREVEKMKKNERKKDFEILKLRNNFDKQVNAFKQKIEKFQSTNKRLNEALSRQRNSQLKNLLKDKKIPKQNMEFWLTKEVEIEALKKIASSEYFAAKENIGHLTEEAADMQKVSSGANEGNKPNALVLLSLEVEKFKKEKISQGDPLKGENNTDRWLPLSSMSDAKTALNVLFEKCVEDYIKLNPESFPNAAEQKKSESNNEDFDKERKKLLTQIKSLKEKILKMKKEKCEQDIKAVQYLKNMNEFEKYFVDNQSDSDMVQKIQSQFEFQKTEIEELSQKLEDCNQLKQEIEFWKEECRKLKMSKKRNYLPAYKKQQQSSVAEESSDTGSMMYEYLDEDVGEDSFQRLDDNEQDPDWRMTPIHKQRKRTINKLKDEGSVVMLDDSGTASKRSFTGCSCPSDCKTMRCACKKKQKMCDAGCNCNRNRCMNVSFEENSHVQGH